MPPILELVEVTTSRKSVAWGKGMVNSLLWVAQAEQKLLAELSGQTPLLKLDALCPGGQKLYLKDESCNPVGSWRQRVARVLFLQALSQRQLEVDKPVISNSPPAMAIAEAWYAQMLGLPYVAVIPDHCPLKESMQIEFCSGICHRVAPDRMQDATKEVASELTGVQFNNLTSDASLLRTAAEPLVREVKEQLTQYESAFSGVTFLIGASEQELNKALNVLQSELRCNKALCVMVAGMDYQQRDINLQHLDEAVSEISPAASQAGVEWLNDLTGRRFSLETGAAYVVIMEGEIPLDSADCLVIIAESAGCHESDQLLTRTKREWLRYRESFQLERWMDKLNHPPGKPETD